MVTDYVEVSRVKTLHSTVSEQFIRFLYHLLEGHTESFLSGIPGWDKYIPNHLDILNFNIIIAYVSILLRVRANEVHIQKYDCYSGL